MTGQESETETVALDSHAKSALSAYLAVQPFYANLADVIARILQECLKIRGIKVHSVQHRAKDPSSFERKAAIPSDVDSNVPKYRKPLEEITDLAGVRVITHWQLTGEWWKLTAGPAIQGLVWRLPLWDPYDKLLESKLANLVPQ
jgi:putative GTP pyrophosphokinase